MSQRKYIPWTRLTGSPLLEKIKSEWQSLLDEPSTKEVDFQKYLSEHAGLFFPVSFPDQGLVISELSLGADFRADFVIASSQYSYGMVYHLIEILSLIHI